MQSDSIFQTIIQLNVLPSHNNPHLFHHHRFLYHHKNLPLQDIYKIHLLHQHRKSNHTVNVKITLALIFKKCYTKCFFCSVFFKHKYCTNVGQWWLTLSASLRFLISLFLFKFFHMQHVFNLIILRMLNNLKITSIPFQWQAIHSRQNVLNIEISTRLKNRKIEAENTD